MILFTKPNCEKCDWIKTTCDLSGVDIQELDEDPEALGLLAYYECVQPAEKGLPILVVQAGNEVILELADIAARLGVSTETPAFDEDCGDTCVL